MICGRSENAALYVTGARGGAGSAEILSGKEMSYNNYVDADAAWQLVCDFDETACAIIKHTNPPLRPRRRPPDSCA